MPTRPSHAFAFLLGFALGLWIFLPLAAPAAFSADAPAARAPGPAGGDPELARLEEDLVDAVNRFRAEHHKIPLARRPDLDRVARGHSDDMATRGYLSHETPEGRNWVDRLAAGHVEGFAMAGENVGLTNKADPNREILEGWIHSPVHRENLLAGAFNATGVGIARSGDGTFYYTQLYLNFPR
jgi:uncharacterized protein YkwD